MSTFTTRLSSRQVSAGRSSRAVAIFTRAPIAALTFILTMIAFRFLINPVQAGSEAGIIFTSTGGITVARVGFGAFPLTFAVFFLTCLFSTRRLLSGLQTELMLLSVVIAVRLVGMAAAHSAETARLLVPEAVLSVLCIVAIRTERNRLEREITPEHQISNGFHADSLPE